MRARVPKRRYANRGVCLRCEKEYDCTYDGENPELEIYCGYCKGLMRSKKKSGK